MTFHKPRVLPLLLCILVMTSATAASASDEHHRVKHVLLLSVDGLHQVDLANWIKAHPFSALAQVSRSAVVYTSASTTTPSDSFPGLLALVTGGTPRSTGVYYDDSYDRTLYPPGSGCVGSPGTEIVYDESVDFDLSKLFSGGINPANLPLSKDSTGCKPVYPHSFIRVNTVFEVVKAAGGRTAWSDKHPAYDLVNGPSGNGVDDLFTPEINSNIANGGTVNGVNLSATLAMCDGTNSLPVKKVQVYTDCIPAVEAYDDVKVQAILNQVDRRKSDGSACSGKGDHQDDERGCVPTVFGMNFQAVSVGQKLPVGGYTDADGTPSGNLEGALAHTDQSIGRMVAALAKRDLLDSTVIIVSAKHGQSPIDKSKLAMESGGSGNTTVTDPLGFVNDADPHVDVDVFHDVAQSNGAKDYAVNGHLQTDDVGIVWLQNQSASNISGVASQLQSNAAAIFADALPSGTIFSSNISSGKELAEIFGDPTSSDPVAAARAPNIFIQPDEGVIYSGSSKKIAEHGGGAPDDTHVALMVSWSELDSKIVSTPVTTTQVAPTILEALGLKTHELKAVRIEHTKPLPHLPF